jgi:hypothetical protein
VHGGLSRMEWMDGTLLQDGIMSCCVLSEMEDSIYFDWQCHYDGCPRCYTVLNSMITAQCAIWDRVNRRKVFICRGCSAMTTF